MWLLRLERLVNIFKALADKNRMRIVKMLQQRPLCVCEITAVLGLATSTVSKHLSILKNADIITDLKDGKWVNYHLNKEGKNIYLTGLIPLLSYWLQSDEQVTSDSKKLKTLDRNIICGG